MASGCVFIVFIIYHVLLSPCPGSTKIEDLERHPSDGWYNNLLHPDWGAIDTHLLRRSGTNYSDGVYQPSGANRPNPLIISNVSFRGVNNLASVRNRNALLVFFGQQLVEEIMDAQRPGCPIEYFNIPVPKIHKYNPEKRDDLEMPFIRARYDQRTGFSPNNPRQQLNEITPYLDGNLMYGAGKSVEDTLRSFKNGQLKAEKNPNDVKSSFPARNDVRIPYANPPAPRDHILRPVKRFRLFGNPRTHENPFLAALAVVWFRYHNHLAAEIKQKNPSFNDEQIFNSARKRVIAQYQKIVMYEWLPAWLHIDQRGTLFNIKTDYPYEGGGKNPYKSYDPNVHPGISTEFQTSALRYGHTLVPSGIFTMKVQHNFCQETNRSVQARYTTAANRDQNNVNVKGIRLCNAFWLPEESLEYGPGMDEVIRGMIYTLAGKEDNIIVSDIREDVFGPLDWSRRDIGALNIQRARDHGLPGYNAVRKAYGLPRKTTWKQINTQSQYKDVINNLKRLYNNSNAPDDLDLFVGGLLETTDDGPGDLFRTIHLDQFLRIRHGDRFWYENKENELFTRDEIQEIENTTFYDILQQVTHALDSKHITPKTNNIFICGSMPNECKCKHPDFEYRKSDDIVEKCEPLVRYDYFTGSELPFLFTVLGIILSVPATVAVMVCLANFRKNSLDASAKGPYLDLQPGPKHFYATEWVGRSTYGLLNSRDVKIHIDDQRQKIMVSNMKGQVVRMIDLRCRIKDERKIQSRVSVTRSHDKGNKLLMLAMPGEIDLVLYFLTRDDRDHGFTLLQAFYNKHKWIFQEAHTLPENVMWREANTVDQRKEILAKFFKRVLAELSENRDDYSSGQEPLEEILATKLTRTEFADALGLQPHSLFVRNMFLLADSSGDGFLSFDEFKNYFGILSAGKPEQKAEMFFKMFDTSRSGKLTKDNYKKMIKSLMELSEVEDNPVININEMVNTVFKKLGRDQQGYLTFHDFKTAMFSDCAHVWKSAALALDVAGESTFIGSDQKTMRQRASSFASSYRKMCRTTSLMSTAGKEVKLSSIARKAPTTKLEIFYHRLGRYVDNHRRQIFWLTLYTFTTIGIFIERGYYYSCEREYAGLRRIAGYGVSVTRGAASAQMFTYASLLVTMSQNTLTYFRETFLHQFIPFDDFHDMHIFIAALAMLFSVVHTTGHLINFYHISTQSSSDLNCYFSEYFRPTHVLASFQYWTYQTLTGLTGVALVLVLVILYVFAVPYTRRHVFNAFTATHNLYIVVYILMFLHGAARLIQPPLWGYYFTGPLLVFIVDKLVSVSRKKVLLPVLRARLMPSGVLNLVFKRPSTFDYQSGQWVRIACPALGKGEYHPFTLTSAPHEDRLSLHIRAVGPWTNNLLKIYDPNIAGRTSLPMIYLDGPFGESHQDWYKYPISVLVGGGIGITPFASILKDIAHRSKEISRLPCQKIYFLWVTRTQQSFEWMTDIIRQVEAVDNEEIVTVHICITQFREQYDLRTTMLYICERHFQKIAGISMFTGLRAKTHFGRPKFHDFFMALKNAHADVGRIGVFSCGPPAMTRSIQQACAEQNAFNGPSFIHHYENF